MINIWLIFVFANLLVMSVWELIALFVNKWKDAEEKALQADRENRHDIARAETFRKLAREGFPHSNNGGGGSGGGAGGGAGGSGGGGSGGHICQSVVWK